MLVFIHKQIIQLNYSSKIYLATFHPPPLSPTSHTIHINYHSNPHVTFNDSQISAFDQFHALIGVVDCQCHHSLDGAYEAFNSTLELLPSHFKPSIRRCWAFNPRDSDRSQSNNNSNIALVEDSEFYLNTLVADIIGSVLSWFADFAGERRKNDGRQSKLYGDLFLMSGRLRDSISCYNDALSQLKAPLDSLYQASALECQSVAQILIYWQKVEDIPRNQITEKFISNDPWSSILDKLTNALSVYNKLLSIPNINNASASTSTFNLNNLPINDDIIVVRSFVNCCLKISSFLLIIWVCEGFNDESLKSLVEGTYPKLLDILPDFERIMTHSENVNITRHQISSFATQAHGTHLFSLNKIEQLKVYLTLISIHDQIGYSRKAAYFRQEAVITCTDLINIARKENENNKNTKIITNLFGDGSGNESLVKILDDISDVYGINNQIQYLYVNDEDFAENDSSSLSFESRFNWTLLQMNYLKDAITIIKTLPDMPALIKYSMILLSQYHNYLNPTEQVKLVQMMLHSLSIIRRRLGKSKKVELAFFSPDPLLSMEVIPLSNESIPFVYSVMRTSIQQLGNTPTLRSTRLAKSMGVKNEPIELIVTLQNPFKFTLDLQQIELMLVIN